MSLAYGRESRYLIIVFSPLVFNITLATLHCLTIAYVPCFIHSVWHATRLYSPQNIYFNGKFRKP